MPLVLPEAWQVQIEEPIFPELLQIEIESDLSAKRAQLRVDVARLSIASIRHGDEPTIVRGRRLT